MKLSKCERIIIDIAVKRYGRPFYRWGHLLGWLSLPIFLLRFVPVFADYTHWMTWLSIFFLFEWYVVVTTRIIGKLKSEVERA